ncbi:MAG: hypothetical protein CL526_10730 [Aequorivita sp.]|nr:hypothetical protein [Aequorivita sp.]
METDKYYHIYNRANGTEKIFVSTENFDFFIRKYQKFIVPVVDTFCYCLMPNHFHFLIKVKSEKQLVELDIFQDFKKKSLFVSKQFSNLFSSYTQAFNKQQGRRGNLFMRPFKRKEIQDKIYFRKLVHYIHLNPVEAGLCKYPAEWVYSSYNALISQKPTLLNRLEVMRHFDTVANFIYVHSYPPQITGIETF